MQKSSRFIFSHSPASPPPLQTVWLWSIALDNKLMRAWQVPQKLNRAEPYPGWFPQTGTPNEVTI